jgi:membrane-associated phospholipid phosphatase
VASAPALAQEAGLQPSPAPASKNNDVAQDSAAVTPVAPAHGVKAFVLSLGHDFKNLPSLETALTLGVGGGLALAASPADKRLTRDAVGTEPFEETFDGGDAVGTGWTQVGGAVGVLVLGHLTSSPKLQAAGSDLVRAQLLNALFTQGLKHAVNRSRPDGSAYSFPSGHASASFASAAVLERHFGWKMGLVAYGVAAYVATSRLSENRHYASDVIFGSALGLVSGRTVSVGHSANRFTVTPIAVPGGVAVSVATAAK